MSVSKQVGNLTVYDNGTNGLSWEFSSVNPYTEKRVVEYHGISGDDMLDYSFDECKPCKFDTLFSEEEKSFFISEYFRIKSHARHRDYYDPYDNCWKDYT